MAFKAQHFSFAHWTLYGPHPEKGKGHAKETVQLVRKNQKYLIQFINELTTTHSFIIYYWHNIHFNIPSSPTGNHTLVRMSLIYWIRSQYMYTFLPSSQISLFIIYLFMVCLRMSIMHTLQCQMVLWQIMNWRGCGRKCTQPKQRYYSTTCLNELNKYN